MIFQSKLIKVYRITYKLVVQVKSGQEAAKQVGRKEWAIEEVKGYTRERGTVPLKMPYYDTLFFEQLRQVSSSNCHQCGDVYMCIKCQKNAISETSSSTRNYQADGRGSECFVVNRKIHQSKDFVLSVLHTLAKFGFCVVDNLVPLELAEKTATEIQGSYQIPGKFTPGKLSFGAMNKVRSLDGIRGDSVMWLDGSSDESVFLSQIAKQMNKLALSLYHANGVAMNRISKSKIMVSCYDGNGKAYKRHIDSVQEGSLKLTLIYYLNKDYEERYGGCLRIHKDSGTLDISPELGKLVIFRSDKLVHEVLPVYNQRFAFTTWYMEVPKRKAIKPVDEDRLETDRLVAETSPKIYMYGSKRIKIEPPDVTE